MTDSKPEGFRLSNPAVVCRHFSRLLQTYACCLYPDNTVRCAFVSGEPSSNPDDAGLFDSLFGKQRLSGRPEIKLARPGEAYISVDLFQEDVFCGKLVAGPMMGATYPLRRQGVYGNAVNQDFAVSAAVLLYYLVYGTWIDEKVFYNAVSSARPVGPARDKDAPGSLKAPEYVRHHSAAFENRLYSFITQGNSKGVAEAMNAPPDGAYGLLDIKHPLRSLKNDCICVLTLATRAAISGGLDSETAFSLSDDAIQHVELSDDVSALYLLVEHTLLHLTKLVEKVLGLNHSYRINACRNYIIQHVYEKLTVSGIAAHAGVTAEYLSGQFKKETGIGLKAFIEKTRLDEAKRLLMSPEKTLLEITLLLNYHDQSHFIRAFKKDTGVSPSAFRKAYGGLAGTFTSEICMI